MYLSFEKHLRIMKDKSEFSKHPFLAFYHFPF